MALQCVLQYVLQCVLQCVPAHLITRPLHGTFRRRAPLWHTPAAPQSAAAPPRRHLTSTPYTDAHTCTCTYPRCLVWHNLVHHTFLTLTSIILTSTQYAELRQVTQCMAASARQQCARRAAALHPWLVGWAHTRWYQRLLCPCLNHKRHKICPPRSPGKKTTQNIVVHELRNSRRCAMQTGPSPGMLPGTAC